MQNIERYSKITAKLPREFLLLQGTGCIWKKCTFCDYYNDTSSDPYKVNSEILSSVTGEFGTLDIINSGSCFEIDPRTLELIQKIVREKRIRVLWFEAHYLYAKKLNDFAKLFPGVEVKFRCGVESFDESTRKIWNKGIPAGTTPQDIARYFKGICLLCCTKGQSQEMILHDIEIAKRYFEYFSVNVFCNNRTKIKRDPDLAEWFGKEIAPILEKDPRIEVLLNNTDLGVG